MSTEPGIDLGRFARIIVLIGFVTAIFMLLSANRLEGEAFQVSAVAVGAVGFLTAILGFLIAAGAAMEES